MQGLDEENTRTQTEIETLKISLQTIEEDITRERGIIIDANSNEKGLRRKKWINWNRFKIFWNRRLSNEDLERAKKALSDEPKSVDEVVNNLADGAINISIGPIKNVKNTIIKIKELIEQRLNQASALLDRCTMELESF